MKVRKYTALLLALLWLGTSCDEDTETGFKTSDEMTMIQYLESEPEQFSRFMQLVEKSGLYGVLNATGTFTGFVPNNEAVDAYLSEQGMSVEGLEEQRARKIVGTSILTGIYNANQFSSGVLADTAFAGNFITMKFGDGGLDNILVNDLAKITKRDIECSNGFVHITDKVLSPIDVSLTEAIQNDSRTSIFAEALDATGLASVLDAGGYTAFVEPDEVFAKAGINNFAALNSLYNDTGDATDPANGLYRFVAFHFLKGKLYSSDLKTLNYETADNSMLGVDVSEGFRVNMEYNTYGELEKWAELDENAIDAQTTNGVKHLVNEVLDPLEPRPVVTTSLIMGVPEIERVRKKKGNIDFYTFFSKDIERWESEEGKYEAFYWAGQTPHPSCGPDRHGSIHFTSYLGNFHFTTDPVAKGRYRISLDFFNAPEPSFGSFDILVDGEFAKTVDPRYAHGLHDLGIFSFDGHGSHRISYRSKRPGRLSPSCVIFTPVSQ
ncbi:hypothetical protein FUAX_07460 [Fulvitalea axinellae]|uniref:FAS1 domain-containing protein n=1 Tax=Fulvitalea axinellae TaxID=1182444 RepID=A0AAU9D1K0_9BACT|nr:hypothetical protein FUAX_07460 [Fulvitalea axinellae]